jgi:hypothetical protein
MDVEASETVEDFVVLGQEGYNLDHERSLN